MLLSFFFLNLPLPTQNFVIAKSISYVYTHIYVQAFDIALRTLQSFSLSLLSPSLPHLFALAVLFHFQPLCIMHAQFSKANKSSAALSLYISTPLENIKSDCNCLITTAFVITKEIRLSEIHFYGDISPVDTLLVFY